MRDYLKLGVVQNAVNLPSLSHEEYVEIAPYIDMAERLGLFLSHATQGNLESIQITYAGRLAHGKTDLIRNAALCGILANTEGDSEQSIMANRINSAALARGARNPRSGGEEGSDQWRRGEYPQADTALVGRRRLCVGHRAAWQLAAAAHL